MQTLAGLRIFYKITYNIRQRASRKKKGYINLKYEKPIAILEIPTMPSNCTDCCKTVNGISPETCHELTHRDPDFNSDTRPAWCPIKYKDENNKKLEIISCEPDNAADPRNLNPCWNYAPYNQIILSWPDIMHRPYLLKKAIHDIREDNKHAEIILYTDQNHNLNRFLSHIDGLTFLAHDKKSLKQFCDLNSKFITNGFPNNVSLRVKLYPGIPEKHKFDTPVHWRWEIDHATVRRDNLPAINTDVCRFVPRHSLETENPE